jgi:hypothetical protein
LILSTLHTPLHQNNYHHSKFLIFRKLAAMNIKISFKKINLIVRFLYYKTQKIFSIFYKKKIILKKLFFYFRLEFDLDFLNQEAINIVSESESFHDAKIVVSSISEISKNEILPNGKKHPILQWDFNTILFSCGVACCMAELKSTHRPDPHFFTEIYTFLLNNNFAFQFYFFTP